MPLINFAGLASGIDSEALIDSIRASRTAQRITPKEDELAEIAAETGAMEELEGLLNELKTILLDFSDLNGGGLLRTVSSTNESAITAIASSAAKNGSYTINTVDQLAKNHTLSFNSAVSITSTSANIITTPGENGRMTIEIGTAPEETLNIDVDDTMSWSELVAEINENTDLATAQLVNTAAPGNPASYKLVINTTNVGTEKGELVVTTTGAHGTLLGSDLDNYFTPDLINEEPAQDAQFTLAGINGTITRSSNTINDIILGVTISLEDVSATPITLQVKTDNSATEGKVKSFVDKFNEIATFLEENNLVTREEQGNDVNNIFGPLANTRVDDGAMTALRSQITASRYLIDDGNGDALNAIRIFADLGITTARDGTLEMDSDEFQDALNSEPDSVNQILMNFANETSKSGKLIEQYTRFNGLIDVVTKGNETRTRSLNDDIARAEEAIEREVQQIRARFARLESMISGLQSQQSALSSALASLPTNRG